MKTGCRPEAGYLLILSKFFYPFVLNLGNLDSWDHRHIHIYIRERSYQRVNVFCFLSSLPLLPTGHHGSVWHLPVISLLLTSSVSRVRTCLSMRFERFRETQKEDERGPLSIKSSLGITEFISFTPPELVLYIK